MIIHISCFFKTAYPFAIFSWLPKRLGKKLSVWRRAKKGRRRLGNERSPNRSFLVGPLFHHLWETVWNWGQTRWEGIQKNGNVSKARQRGRFANSPWIYIEICRQSLGSFLLTVPSCSATARVLSLALSAKIWLGVVVEVVDELLHDRCSGVFLTFVHFKMIVDGGWWMGGLWWLSASVRSDYSLYMFVIFDVCHCNDSCCCFSFWFAPESFPNSAFVDSQILIPCNSCSGISGVIYTPCLSCWSFFGCKKNRLFRARGGFKKSKQKQWQNGKQFFAVGSFVLLFNLKPFMKKTLWKTEAPKPFCWTVSKKTMKKTSPQLSANRWSLCCRFLWKK